MKKIRVGIIGFGTIGSGVVKVLQARRAFLREKSGIDIAIAKICDKDLKTARPVRVSKSLLTRSITNVIYDPEIDIIVELVGGIVPAKDIIMEALRQGKRVVTANKALISEFGPEIFGLAGKLGLSVGFEASVGGGIPIIRALKDGFIADRLELVYGIVNGTSNFILSRMDEEGIGFKEALTLAQGMGYAEADPRLDISGMDACHKLAILATIGFASSAKPRQIYTEGIAGIEPGDIRYAAESGYAIKSLAVAKRSARGLELRVHPTLIPSSHLLASVRGVSNAIFVKGDLVGENLFYGQGAGKNPTSSAVVSDIIALAREFSQDAKSVSIMADRKNGVPLRDINDIRMKYYIRFSALDKPGVLAKISGILARYRISIASVTQKQHKSAGAVPIVMMTHDALERDMSRALDAIDRLPVIKKKSVRIRIEE